MSDKVFLMPILDSKHREIGAINLRSIDYITPCPREEMEATKVFMRGTAFYCNVPYKELLKQLRKYNEVIAC